MVSSRYKQEITFDVTLSDDAATTSAAQVAHARLADYYDQKCVLPQARAENDWVITEIKEVPFKRKH